MSMDYAPVVKYVQIGDRIRISVELLKEIYESNPKHWTQVVELIDVRDEGGIKTLILSTNEECLGLTRKHEI